MNGHGVVFSLYQIVSGIHGSSVQRRLVRLVIERHSALIDVRRALRVDKRRGRRRGEAVNDIMNRDLCEQGKVRSSISRT